MVRYLFFIGSLTEGGAERVLSLLTQQLVEQGNEVELLTYYDRTVFYNIDSRVRVVSVEHETGTTQLPKNMLWLRKEFRKHADVVISFLAPFNMVAIVSNFLNKVPLVVADRVDPRVVPKKYIIRKIRDFLYRLADGVVVQTTYNLRYFPKTVQKKSVVIFNPLMMGDMQGKALQTEKRKEIVSVGRLNRGKNQQMLIRSFFEVYRKHPEYHLTIYGEGPERENLTELIENYNLSDAITLPGQEKNLHEKILSAEMFILPSDYEGMSNALMEAMCLGLPCITTDVSGASDLINSGENGVIIPVNDQRKLTEAMVELIENPQLRQKYGNRAIEIGDRVSLPEITAQWVNFCDLVMR